MFQLHAEVLFSSKTPSYLYFFNVWTVQNNRINTIEAMGRESWKIKTLGYFGSILCRFWIHINYYIRLMYFAIK